MSLRVLGESLFLWTFFREFSKDPSTFGSLIPSSSFLAVRVVEAADIRPGHVVVELGAGTGVVTKVLRRKYPSVQIICLEPSEKLSAVLREECPDVYVSEKYAQELPDILKELNITAVDRVISGLPFTMWSEEVQNAIFDALGKVMTPDSRFLTYTYVFSQMMPKARKMRATLRRYFTTVSRTNVEWVNVPPAVVFVCDRPVASNEA